MRGKVAKSLRRQVYGDLSLKDRKYKRHSKTGQILADDKRQEYQKAKRQHNEISKNPA